MKPTLPVRAGGWLVAALLLAGCAAKQSSPTPAVADAPRAICANPNVEGAMLSFATPVVASEALTVAAVGDVLLHDTLQTVAAGQASGILPMLAPVADLLRGADVTFANLEGPAAANLYNTGREGPEPKGRYDGRIYTGYPMFNYHPAVLGELKEAGIDILLTANNHALDRQALGVDRTIEAIQAAGLPWTGTRHRDAMTAPWYAVTEVPHGGRTRRLAWLGCTYGTNEIPDRHGQVLFCFEQQEAVLATIRQLAADPTLDAVFLAPHWGREYRHDPTDRQRKLAVAALEAGATAVIGTHPHVLQPLELHRTADRREGLVAFSLGNFLSGQTSLARRSSAILLLALMPGTDGKLVLADARFVPTFVERADGGWFVQSTDRSGRGAKSRTLVLEQLPAGNLHPPATPFWSGAACAPTTTS